MEIFVVGLSYKTAPISVHNKIMVSGNELLHVLNGLKQNKMLKESMLLSTGNRIELYGLIQKKCLHEMSLFSIFTSLYPDLDVSIDEYLYCYISKDVVKHLFKVSAGLDSFVFGESQIFDQVKKAYKTAVQNANTGPVLNRLLHKAFTVTRNIRANIHISKSTESVGFASVEIVKKIFNNLSNLMVMVIGAGEIGMLTANHYSKCGVTKFLVADRSFKRSENFAASIQGTAIQFQEIDIHLNAVDIVVICVGNNDVIIKNNTIKHVMKERNNKSIVFIDLCTPRNIDERAKDIRDVYVFDIDDLKEVLESNCEQRKHEAIKIEMIIEKEIQDFFTWYETFEVLPTVKQIQEHFEVIRRSEIKKNKNKLKGSDLEQVEILTKSIINRILDNSVLRLKETADTQEGNFEAEALRRLFNLK